MRNSIISLDKGNSSDRGYNCEAKLLSEHFLRPAFEGSVNMDLQDVDKDDYLKKEFSCKTIIMLFIIKNAVESSILVTK